MIIKDLIDLLIRDLDEAIERGNLILGLPEIPQEDYLRSILAGLQKEKDICTEYRSNTDLDISRFDHEGIDKLVKLILGAGAFGAKFELYLGMNFLGEELENLKLSIEVSMEAGDFVEGISDWLLEVENSGPIPIDSEIYTRGTELLNKLREAHSCTS